MKTFVVLAGVLGLLAVGCGGGSSPATDGGRGGSGGAASTGKGGSSGAAGAGQGGQGGVGGQLAGIPAACQSCAETMCASTLIACAGNTTCTDCVQNDYQTCVTNKNAQYAAVCSCAKGPCSACDSYCP